MQMRNRQVVEAFVQDRPGHDGYGAVSSKGSGLYSYNAKIAEWDGGTILVHDGWDGYSPTTSKHFKYLHDALDENGAEWEATHEPADRSGKRKSRWY